MSLVLKDKFIKLTAPNRLYKCPVPIIGLTGGIATGKSTVSQYLQDLGLPVICADQLIKTIYSRKASLEFIKNEFPSAISQDQIKFYILRKMAFDDYTVRERLEHFLYPQLNEVFLETLNIKNAKNFVIYDVPLLFEKQMNKLVDYTACVYSPTTMQIDRLISRDKIQNELANKIIAQQMDIEKKKDLADWIIVNCADLIKLRENVDHFLKIIFKE